MYNIGAIIYISSNLDLRYKFVPENTKPEGNDPTWDLVLMAVGVKNCQKAPISFHFFAGTNAETSVLIKQLIVSP